MIKWNPTQQNSPIAIYLLRGFQASEWHWSRLKLSQNEDHLHDDCFSYSSFQIVMEIFAVLFMEIDWHRPTARAGSLIGELSCLLIAVFLLCSVRYQCVNTKMSSFYCLLTLTAQKLRDCGDFIISRHPQTHSRSLTTSENHLSINFLTLSVETSS